MDEIETVHVGDFRDIDEYVDKLQQHGIDADYENVVHETAGFIAHVYVNDEKHCTWEGSSVGQMVRNIHTPLNELKEKRKR